jgi:hypothetical protein
VTGKFDATGRELTLLIRHTGAKWILSGQFAALTGDTDLNVAGLQSIDVKPLGPVRVSADNRDWLLVRMATLANTVDLRFYRLDGCRVSAVEVDGVGADLLVGGGISRGQGLVCRGDHSGPALALFNIDWLAHTATERDLIWDGQRLTGTSHQVVLPTQGSAGANQFYQLSCTLTTGAPARA